MYFVDLEKVENILNKLERQIELFQKINDLNDDLQQAAFERSIHVMIDSVLDVGNAMIDGFIMRDPGSYDDIVDILLDEKVITEEMAKQLKIILPYRKTIVQDYTNVNYEEIYQTVKRELNVFIQYPAKIREYLKNELGPVSAFKRQDQ